MRNKAGSLKEELIQSVLNLVRTRLPKNKAAAAAVFVKHFYGNVPPHDLLGEEPEDLFGAAITMWNFGRDRVAGTAKVRAYNPKFEVNGWQSAHTVIEIANDDMPFLVDSVTSALSQLDLTVHLVIHPILNVKRNAKGTAIDIVDLDKKDKDAVIESFMHLQVSEQTSDEDLRRIETTIDGVLSDVRAAVEDWRKMRARALDVVAEIEKSPPPLDKEDVSEALAFLRWIEDNNFTFLGCRQYDYKGKGKAAKMEVVKDSGLGILRDPDSRVFDNMRELGELPRDIRDFLLQPELLLIMKANRKSTIHRPVHLDSITVRKFDKSGKVIGEHRFVGLFTSVAYNQRPKDIPLLRHKVDLILQRAGFAPASHDGKALVNTLETYPRDEFFQASESELFETGIGILHLQERPKTALFIRKDAFERFVSCLVFVPRDHYTTELRTRISEILSTALNGSIAAYYTQMSDSAHARLQIIVKTTRGEIPEFDLQDLEDRIVEASRSWEDKLHQELIDSKGEEVGNKLIRRYGHAFPTAFKEAFNAHAAVFDMERMEAIADTDKLGINLFRPIGADDTILHLKYFHSGDPVPLSDVMPMIENMGLKVIAEVPFEVVSTEFEYPIWIHDFEMEIRGETECDLSRIKDPFQEAFTAVWNGQMENDRFNALVLIAGLDWHEVSVVRAYARYLRQARFTFSLVYMQDTLINHPNITRRLVDLFHARFDPAKSKDREKTVAAITAEIEEMLDEVSNLDEDRILRRFINLFEATLRTNVFQKTADGENHTYMSFKFDSQNIEELPLPRPLREIWVHSPEMEGVHLRGGLVARGGIRWSDRREDFRTEILGLMKAQQVKNAVIVPVGSKGGFIIKNPIPGATREQFMEQGIECYKTLMRGMLDITDNINGADILPPDDVMRYDDDDPYLVVAADKGTATFSDIANGVSIDYGFWLGDAFASGGSAGYDHKKMGITAKGGWESVKRHFREIGTNIQEEDFTVVGVGDMSGDVFGNGMLLSKHIRLLGGFNHLHIFVDPDPDSAKSWVERKRMFDLPRSSWSDYNSKLISKGGGVFDRSAKSIDISPEMKRAFDIDASSLTPNALITAMLKAPSDLLWFGGIGTYIKSSEETHVDAGDRANDAVRIDATEVNAKVVGEGANLGVTQRARIEYALGGGRINTDAIDNSAGVDCSDHEVNIKVLLGDVVANGDMTEKQRDQLLEAMTDEVSELVLKDNYDQTQALTMAQSEGVQALDVQGRVMKQLERSHVKLNREIEFLPDDETLAERAQRGEGLTRPELAVMLAYAKMELYDEILPSDLPDDPSMVEDLQRYFPERLRKQYKKEISGHRLSREIIATYLTNSMINRVGANFVNEVRDQTGDSAHDIAKAYLIARDVFNVRGMWGQVEDMDNKVPAEIQTRMLMDLKRLVSRGGIWFLRNAPRPLNISAMTKEYSAGLAELRDALGDVMSDFDRREVERTASEYERHGIPSDLATAVAGADVTVSGCDIVRLAQQTGQSVRAVSEIYFGIGSKFALDWLRQRAEGLEADTHWQKMATTAVVEDFFNHQMVLTQNVIAANGAGKGKPAKGKANGAGNAIDTWSGSRQEAVDRTARLLSDLRSTDNIDLAMLAVANGQLRSLVAG